jgi:hypothetical protein
VTKRTFAAKSFNKLKRRTVRVTLVQINTEALVSLVTVNQKDLQLFVTVSTIMDTMLSVPAVPVHIVVRLATFVMLPVTYDRQSMWLT